MNHISNEAQLVSLMGQFEAPPTLRDEDADLWFYRRRTVALLRRYARASIEVGRLPSLLGREFFRSRVTSYTMRNFEDVVIFVTDMERAIARLDDYDKKLLAMNILEEYTIPEVGRLLGCTQRTVERALQNAIDQLSRILLAGGLLEEQSLVSKCCQEGKDYELKVSDSNKWKNKRDCVFHARWSTLHAMPKLRAVHRWLHRLAPSMLAALLATLLRVAQSLRFIPSDEVWFPLLVLVAWVLFLYWVLTGPRAVRLYRKAYKEWARERRVMAYGIAISAGAAIGAVSGGVWWKIFELQRRQMQTLQDKRPESKPAQPVSHQEPQTTNETTPGKGEGKERRGTPKNGNGKPVIPPLPLPTPAKGLCREERFTKLFDGRTLPTRNRPYEQHTGTNR